MITMKELCENAIAAQSAVNLSGIVHAFSRDVSELRILMMEQNGGQIPDTKDVNRHPVCVLYAHAVSDLTGISGLSGLAYEEFNETFRTALRWCMDQVSK